ncbi:SGNH/GDSL hydrolase family protein [Actinomyces ruminicola]|uniref:GDSL-like Lipase/Acylhydrolase family protein n=1 Tax=Actinomyces ruminicola TaxID=332524 RepID=A0A1H0A5H1_9ACTO|nr:SGNH/GDSL hydrolase family protein [Actinomyces ruminicola]SDN28717.1 GDSL-like Lipase/Acylhydrolase family protein [Actinomyces ruminicola]
MMFRPRRSLHTLMAGLLALTILLPSLVIASPTAAAAPAGGSLRVVLLGDSYSAGNGAGDYYGDDKSAYRSRNNWAHRYVDWVNTQNVSATLTNLAHSGAVTDDLLGRSGQVAAMPTDTDLVMLTIGGNDVGFADIVQKCFMLGMRDAKSCKTKVDSANALMDDVMASTSSVLQKIDERLPDGAQVILVGYPRLATSRSYILKNLFGSFSYDAGTGVRALSETARTKQAALARNWNAAHPGLKVTYIDGVVAAFDGHEPDPATNSRNDYRWLNEFFETRGRLAANGKTTSTFSLDAAEFYHPNIIGHQQIASLIINQAGVPSNVKPASSPAIAPAAYAVSSTVEADGKNAPEAWIQGPYVAQEGSTLSLDARGSYAGDGTITAYEWDLDGDGVFEQTSAEPVIDYTFDDLYDGQISLRVAQDDGQTDVYTTQVQITDDGDNTPPDLDNCPTVNNYSQSDYDGDGVGDACDPDPGYPTEDQPGVCVVGENCPDDDAAAPTPGPDSAATDPDPTDATHPAVPDSAGQSAPSSAPTPTDTTDPEAAAPAPDAAGDAAAAGNQPATAADSPTAPGTAVAPETMSSPYATPTVSTAHDTRTRLANTGFSPGLPFAIALAATAVGTVLIRGDIRRQLR